MNTFLKQAEEGNKSVSSKKELIRCFINLGNNTIPELSREMNISVPTVTKLIGELIDEGIVYDFGKQDTAGGRRPNVYGLNPDAVFFAGAEIKMDSIEMGLINFKGELTQQQTFGNFSLESSKESFEKLCEIINTFLDSVSVPRDKIIAVGLNLSGRVNSESGYSYSFYYVDELPLSKQVEDRIGCQVFVENDSRAMAYGEYMCGAVQDEKDIIFINISWGMGIGIILDHKLVYGKSGFSGEYGHFPYFDNEIMCRCGKRGCLETEVSGSALHRIFINRLREGSVSILSEKFEKGETISLDDIMNAVDKGDVLAIEIVESVGRTLGKAISGLINLFNPELIIIGGVLSSAKDYLLLPVKGAVNKHSLSLVSKDTNIRLSKLGSKAGVIGACMLVRGKILGLL